MPLYKDSVVHSYRELRPQLADDIDQWFLALEDLAQCYDISANRNRIPILLEEKTRERFSLDHPSLVIISGPSGVGKESVRKLLPESVSFIPNFTSRKPRLGEVNGVDYHFVTEDEMRKVLERKEVLFTKEGYAFPIQEVLEGIQMKRQQVVEIRMNTWLKLKEKYKDQYPSFFKQDYLLTFLLPPASHLLALRILQRTQHITLPEETLDRDETIFQIMRGLSEHWLLELTKREEKLMYLVNDDSRRVASIIAGLFVDGGNQQ